MGISEGTPSRRADARHNRQRLLDAAVREFSSGAQKVTLDAIAKRAGVGIGTLYRHFPTREALVEAVYRGELARLRGSAEELLATCDPETALRRWMDRFTELVSAKRGMADTLRAVFASGAISTETRATLTDTVRRLLAAGADAGTLRDDVEPTDVLASITGVFLSAGAPDQRAQAGRMLDLLVDGLRTPAARQRHTP